MGNNIKKMTIIISSAILLFACDSNKNIEESNKEPLHSFVSHQITTKKNSNTMVEIPQEEIDHYESIHNGE